MTILFYHVLPIIVLTWQAHHPPRVWSNRWGCGTAWCDCCRFGGACRSAGVITPVIFRNLGSGWLVRLSMSWGLESLKRKIMLNMWIFFGVAGQCRGIQGRCASTSTAFLFHFQLTSFNHTVPSGHQWDPFLCVYDCMCMHHNSLQNPLGASWTTDPRVKKVARPRLKTNSTRRSTPSWVHLSLKHVCVCVCVCFVMTMAFLPSDCWLKLCWAAGFNYRP